MCILAGIAASTAFIGVIAPTAASAGTARPQTRHTERDGGGDDDDRGGVRSHDGNGTRNRNIISLKSPSSNHGYQHTSASTAGGSTAVQNALCRHAKVCNIHLQIIVVVPKKPRKPGSTKTKEPEVDTAAPDDECEDE
ncbi:hypothetical protein AB0B89_14385 [Sphaerisporangium sp. NPDC049002]|uniref:hypothetical protein n=1 Tax=unclassified Sphaerisporangium TaxID=2630420 RepID=UPI0033E84B7E